MGLLTVSSYSRFFAIVKEEIQNSGQPSAVMADFELALLQASYIIILSLDILVQIQKVLDIMTIRIRPCGKTPLYILINQRTTPNILLWCSI